MYSDARGVRAAAHEEARYQKNNAKGSHVLWQICKESVEFIFIRSKVRTRDWQALYAGIKEAIIKHGGQHTVDYIFQLYMGKK